MLQRALWAAVMQSFSPLCIILNHEYKSLENSLTKFAYICEKFKLNLCIKNCVIAPILARALGKVLLCLITIGPSKEYVQRQVSQC